MNIPNSVIEDAKAAGFSDVFVSDYGRVFAKFAELTLARNLPQWISVDDRLPELKDDSVLAHFENGSIETIHIEDFFKTITNGFDADGNQLYTKWYLHHEPKVTHWQTLPAAPQPNTENAE